MRFIGLFLLSFLTLNCLAQKEEIEFEEYSYTEFFQMIEEETDSVFRLENAIIKYGDPKDSLFFLTQLGTEKNFNREDTIAVTKEVRLENVLFSNSVPDSLSNPSEGKGRLRSTLYQIRFLEEVWLKNCDLLSVDRCVFDKLFNVKYDDRYPVVKDQWIQSGFASWNDIKNSTFFGGVDYSSLTNEYINTNWGLISCIIHPAKDGLGNSFWYRKQFNFWITDCTFLGEGPLIIRALEGDQLNIDRNQFGKQQVSMQIGTEGPIQRIEISQNNFDNIILMTLPVLKEDDNVDWDQFRNGIINRDAYNLFYDYRTVYKIDSLEDFIHDDDFYSTKNIEYYFNSARIKDAKVNRDEMKLLGKLYNHYRQQHAAKFANGVFIEMKDLETANLAYIYQENPTFDSFFQWKINQFLKLFADYGTRPSKAIVFAVYVIAFFALIYLFFPNSWDAHGRTRIMDRYRFFLKYLNRNEGASEVYQEEKEKELLPFHEFREVLEREGKTAPKFFYATALPLYKWSVSGSRLSGWFLSKIDVLNGKWSDVPEKGRVFKSALVIGAFIIALLYDLFIKVLNAIMLSINTFTTLGFGEIPIKGLPRYLAIVQGFIGWFMLTIFSVSLISQLLN
ncbi:ion channel [Ekhidna sp.]|uniref:ion channel n=1 Tax=Ekhidna sp. TaxID=2608089 RepID=UPI003BACFBAE